MNLLTQLLHLVGTGAVAYMSARNLRDRQMRPHTLAALQLTESGSVPFLEALRDRATAEGNTWLAEQLTRHASDERRHGQIFAHALKQMHKQAIDLASVPPTQADGTPDERRRSPFFAAYFDGYAMDDLGPAKIDWTVFFASTYILELDASQDFARMAAALPDDPVNQKLRQGMMSIAADETRHAAYLRTAMERELPAAAVETLIDHWRTRKVNAMLAMVQSFLKHGGQLPEMARDGVPPELAETLPEATPIAA